MTISFSGWIAMLNIFSASRGAVPRPLMIVPPAAPAFLAANITSSEKPALMIQKIASYFLSVLSISLIPLGHTPFIT